MGNSIRIIWNFCDNIEYNGKIYWGYQFTHREVRWCIFQYTDNKKTYWYLVKQIWNFNKWQEEYTCDDMDILNFEEIIKYAKIQIIIPDKYNHDENFFYHYKYK